MSLPHWIKWNKDKGMYKISNSMECFEQNKKISLTLNQLKMLKIALNNEYVIMNDEIDSFPEHKKDLKIIEQIFKKLE